MYYEYKRRFKTRGLEGFKDLPPASKSHPQTTPLEVAKRTLELSLTHLVWGYNRLSNALKIEGACVSTPEVEEIPNAHGMSTRYHCFPFLHTFKQPEAAVAVLHTEVLPFYREKGIPVSTVLTNNGKGVCGRDGHLNKIYLDLKDLTHRTTQVRHPQSNSFMERFNRTVLEKFLRQTFRLKFSESVRRYRRVWMSG